MTKGIERWKSQATWQGMQALGAGLGSAALFAWVHWIPGVGAGVFAGYLAYRWFMFRARHGLRF
ncbi:MAG: hypothetical protein HYY84_03320 [Deltaproteobacteria bacterium]|nr:hypothetical protein [Deltaproteobacteria bacterium]